MEPQVTLVDGRVVSSYSNEWRAETYERHKAALSVINSLSPPVAMEAALLRLGEPRDEHERRLRVVVHDLLRGAMRREAEAVLAMAHKDDRNAHCNVYEARWGAALAGELRDLVRAIWAERRVAAEKQMAQAS